MVLISPRRASHSAGVRVVRVSDDLFRLLGPTDTIGFIHKVDRVYVALKGPNLSHAVEVGQSLSWDRAIEAVRAA